MKEKKTRSVMSGGKISLPQNPRYPEIENAISWSDVTAIESNVKNWLDGKRLSPSLSTDFGTFVHLQIKHKKIKGVPHGNNPEKKLAVKTKHFVIAGKPDDYDDEIVHEYKSAKELWSRRKAETHEQMFAYSFLLWKTDGILRKKALLTSLETRYDEDLDDIVLTGKMQTIEVPIRLLDVLKIQVRFEKAYNKVIEEIKRREVGQGADN